MRLAKSSDQVTLFLANGATTPILATRDVSHDLSHCITSMRENRAKLINSEQFCKL